MENENQNTETGAEQGRFDTPMPETQSQPSSVSRPSSVSQPIQYQQTVKLPNEPVKHMSLGVASIVLGGISMLCCWMYGLGVIPAVIGAIFGLIALIKGEKKARVLGGIGLGLSLVGLVLGIIMILTYASMINWDNVTIENLVTIQDVDPDDNDAILRWLQQFFNVDITRYAR